MAKIRTRQGLIDYCLRRLGHPVIEINVDEDQVSDRVDDALQFFYEYHFDGVERVYVKHQMTQAELDQGWVSMTSASDFKGDETQAVTEAGLTGTVPIEDTIASVIQIYPVTQSTYGMWDVRYQYAMNDLYTLGSLDMVQYTMTQQYLSLLRQILSPDKCIRFNRRGNKLYFDGKATWMVPGDYIIIEAYRVMDPTVSTEIYDDMLLKKYLTELIKRQWGQNLSKFNGIALLGGVTMNGAEIYSQAQEQITKMEEEIIDRWELPVDFIVG